jgi:hypothetical protein
LGQTDLLPSTLIEIAIALITMSVPMFVYGHLVFAIVWIGGYVWQRYRERNCSLWLLALMSVVNSLFAALCLPIFISAYTGMSMTEVPGTAISMIQNEPLVFVAPFLFLLAIFAQGLWSEKQRRDKKAP